MYIESVPNRASPPAILLRESYRDGGKVKKSTLLYLSDWPRERIRDPAMSRAPMGDGNDPGDDSQHHGCAEHHPAAGIDLRQFEAASAVPP